MVQFYDRVSNELRDWALAQDIFFVASAPRYGKHVNVSPKGLPASTLSVLDPNTACYVDATGSGAETIAHLYETGRVTVMFCSFDKSPRIMRLFCTGRVIEYDELEYKMYLEKMGKPHASGARAIILLNIFKVQTSCGYGVPIVNTNEVSEKDQASSRLPFEDRKTLGHWASQQVEKGKMEEYRKVNNVRSLDGVPGLKAARRYDGEILWFQDAHTYVKQLKYKWDAILIGVVLALSIIYIVDLSRLILPLLSPYLEHC